MELNYKHFTEQTAGTFLGTSYVLTHLILTTLIDTHELIFSLLYS